MDVQFRVNVTAANFPLLSSLHGRSLLTREPQDSNYVTVNAYGGASSDRDVGVPSYMYLHNVLPTVTGVTSVGYKKVSGAADTTARYAQVLRTCKEVRYIYLPTVNNNYILLHGTWLSIGGFSNNNHVTYAHIHKATYICHAYSHVQKLNETTMQLELVDLKGLNVSQILGVTHANNYLISYTTDTIHWSSIIDSEDFMPQLKTRAGSIIPLHVRGAIVGCLNTSNGFIIFTTVNAVRATYVGDKDLPFRFEEIANSGGIKTLEHVTNDNNHESFYCWTNKGLQLFNKLQGAADQAFPEVTDFLTSHIFEDYIGDTGKRTSTNESGVWSSQTESWVDTKEGYSELKQWTFEGELQVKVAIIANRYLVISYALPTSKVLTHCLVYDLTFKRWGKLKVNHIDCFELDPATSTAFLVEPNHQLGFLQTDGSIKVLDMEAATVDTDSVLIFGKIQSTRNKVCTLHAIEVENTLPRESELSVFTSLDGKNFNPAIYPIRQIDTKYLSRWLMRTTGINHSFKLTGTFDIVSIQGMLTICGAR